MMPASHRAMTPFAALAVAGVLVSACTGSGPVASTPATSAAAASAPATI
ncbi:MAG: hypothetical protein QOJ75_38, partial [Chloroflexota bacterium]|nr:hypothetical protein [Chloroflexota bacterium]